MLQQFQSEILKINITVRIVKFGFLLGELIEPLVNFVLVLTPHILSFPKQVIDLLVQTHRFFDTFDVLLLGYLNQQVKNVLVVVIQILEEHVQVLKDIVSNGQNFRDDQFRFFLLLSLVSELADIAIKQSA